MPKYRLLDTEELVSLQKQFIHFLAMNGISNDLWERIKISDTERVNNLLSEFSDFIFDSTLGNIDLLEQRAENSFVFYYFENESLNFIGIDTNNKNMIDFNLEFNIDDLIITLSKFPDNFTILKGSKKNNKGKLVEFFYLMEAGCKISKNTELFSFLKNK